MQKSILITGLTLLSLGSSVRPALAQPAESNRTVISMADLKRYGVNPRTIALATIAPDNRQVAATDDPPFNEKRKGTLRRIWLIDLESDLKPRLARHIDLAVPEIEQLTYTPDGRSILFITRRGAELYRVDLASGKQTRLMGHVPGTPGIRLEPPVMSSYNKKVYCQGYAYDSDDVSTPTQLFELDPFGMGASAFTPVTDLAGLERSAGRLSAEVSLCPEGGFFVQRVGGSQQVARWTANGAIQKIDSGSRLTGVWGDGTHFLYAISKPGGQNELVLAEATTGEHKVIASGPLPYYNPVLAKQATSLMVATVDPINHSVAVWTGQDVDGYTLKSLLKRIPASVFRVSPDGQLVAVFNHAQGLMLIKLP